MYFLRAAHRSARLRERGKQVITYRNIRPPDCAELGRIIVDTWQFDQFTAGPKGAGHFGQSYLLSCLLRESYTCVALREGRPVGVIVGSERRKGKKQWHWGAFFRALRHTVPLLFDRAFRKGNGEWSGYGETLAALDREVGYPFDAEIALFLVDGSCRGLGIGKRLYQNLMDHFAAQGVESFYVHTDTGCNHRFYEAQGLQRLAEARTHFSYAGVENVTVFVYGKKK